MKKKIFFLITSVCAIFLFFGVIFFNVLFPRKYSNLINVASNENVIEKSLVYAIIKAEINFNKNAKSGSGALGLMQLMPTTAKWIASELEFNFEESDLFKPEINIKFGCYYIGYLFEKFSDVDTVIAAYNAGYKNG